MEHVPGTRVLAGKYRLIHQLGKGGMGSVWLAHHLTLQSQVAIKLIEPQIASNPEALTRFMREARAAAALRSPHVVQILDHGVDDGTPYIAMELLEGESLADRLRKVGRLSPADTARVLTHTARAISRAHEAGITHRDLKPDNIFLIENEEEELAKVLDFGIAKSTTAGLGASAAAETRTGALLGTLHYMSPEQAEAVKSVDFRTDIWAMGVIAFECLLGRRPFDGETVATVVLEICTRPPPLPSRLGQVPAGFDVWFARACARTPTARFPSAREAAAALRRICQVRGAVSEDRSEAEETAPARRRPIGKYLGVGVAVTAAVVVAVFIVNRPITRTPAPPALVSAPPAQATVPPPASSAPAIPAPEVVAAPVAPALPNSTPPGAVVVQMRSPPTTARQHRRHEKPTSKPAAKDGASATIKASAPGAVSPPPVTPAATGKPKVNLGI